MRVGNRRKKEQSGKKERERKRREEEGKGLRARRDTDRRQYKEDVACWNYSDL